MFISGIICNLFFLKVYLSILERESEQAWGDGVEGQREKIPQADSQLNIDSDVGLDPLTHEPMT